MMKAASLKNNVTSSKKTAVVALAGNPNVGKTSVFNALTGSRQHTGNWPGVTVEKKEGIFTMEGIEVKVVDLPGIYGLSAYSLDERIARDFLMHEKPDVVVVVIDSSNLERNLYLALELLEMNQNVVIDLNMIDLAEKQGIIIDTELLSKLLNIPVVKTVAVKNEGIEKLKKVIVEAAASSKKATDIKYPSDIEKHVQALKERIEELHHLSDVSARWLAIKLIEQDAHVLSLMKAKLEESFSELNTFLMDIVSNLEKEKCDETSVIITQARYSIVHSIAKRTVKKKRTFQDKISLTDKLDKIFTNRAFGIPIFLLMMWVTFQITFSIGGALADLIDTSFAALSEYISSLLEKLGASGLLISFISDGIIGGVGSVLVFLPNIFLLFLAIAILEDSGYMARAAFVMDRLMSSIGLSGKSFIPMILGFGCNVPAIMATRTIEPEKDRVITVLVNPLISCSARLPIYTLFATAFFPKNQGLVIFSIYLIGIVLAIVMAKLFSVLLFKREVSPLIMELPPYRLPSMRNALSEATRRSLIFLRKAGTLIFTAVILLWVLASFPSSASYASEESFAGMLGKLIAPIFKPAGFGFWQAGVALLFGTMAKEVVVGTFGALYGGESLTQVLKNVFTPLSAYSFMIFSLIYLPCIATIAAIKREIGWKWTLVALAYLPFLAWLSATLIYQIGSLIIK